VTDDDYRWARYNDGRHSDGSDVDDSVDKSASEQQSVHHWPQRTSESLGGARHSEDDQVVAKSCENGSERSVAESVRQHWDRRMPRESSPPDETARTRRNYSLDSRAPCDKIRGKEYDVGCHSAAVAAAERKLIRPDGARPLTEIYSDVSRHTTAKKVINSHLASGEKGIDDKLPAREPSQDGIMPRADRAHSSSSTMHDCLRITGEEHFEEGTQVKLRELEGGLPANLGGLISPENFTSSLSSSDQTDCFLTDCEPRRSAFVSVPSSSSVSALRSSSLSTASTSGTDQSDSPAATTAAAAAATAAAATTGTEHNATPYLASAAASSQAVADGPLTVSGAARKSSTCFACRTATSRNNGMTQVYSRVQPFKTWTQVYSRLTDDDVGRTFRRYASVPHQPHCSATKRTPTTPPTTLPSAAVCNSACAFDGTIKDDKRVVVDVYRGENMSADVDEADVSKRLTAVVGSPSNVESTVGTTAENNFASKCHPKNSGGRHVSSAIGSFPSGSSASHTPQLAPPSSFVRKSERPRVPGKKTAKKQSASVMQLPWEMTNEFLDRVERATCPDSSSDVASVSTSGDVELSIFITHVANMRHFWGQIIEKGQFVRFLLLVLLFLAQWYN
jgi:hypothetical protein